MGVIVLVLNGTKWNPAEVLQIMHLTQHGTNAMCCKNYTFRNRNQVEPSRNQAKVL